MTNPPDNNIDINEIMQEVRREILEQRQGIDHIAVRVKGERLPAAFYEHLYLASMTYNKTETDLYVTRSPIPLLGPLIDWLRGKLHQVVIFYVNRSVVKQVQINRHLLQALSIMAEELERSGRDAAEPPHPDA